MIEVNITKIEYEMAMVAGKARQFRAIAKRYKDKHGYDGSDGIGIHVNGAAAELAYAKLKKIYFDGNEGSFKRPDMGDDIQIRWTRHENGMLILRPGDDPEHFYVLVVGDPPYFKVVGHIKGSNAMQDKYFTDFGKRRPKVWGIPQSDLVPEMG